MKGISDKSFSANRRLILSTIPAALITTLPGCSSAIRMPGGEGNAAISNGFEALQAYCGVYRFNAEHTLGIDRFINDSGEGVLLWTDHRTGAVRRIFNGSTDEFSIGPGFNTRDPVQQTIRFMWNKDMRVVGLTASSLEGESVSARKASTREEEVVFSQGDAKLRGTLIHPEGSGPHPAIILLHGSGPLTRYSFGPYPRFFNSLGFAVLVFDKRGTGDSTGWRIDASTGAPEKLSPSYYPDDLLADATAALNLLRTYPGIDPDRIGFWGSSEGGMLSTQMAARSQKVAFAINSSGFMGPLWQTLLYQVEINMKARGHSRTDIEHALEFNRFALEVARTGNGFDTFLERREKIVQSGNAAWIGWYIGEYSSLSQMRWSWDHILSFNPLLTLGQVSCPTLGVFGEFDLSTDASTASVAMRDAILAANSRRDVTVKVIPNASHSLMERHAIEDRSQSNRMAPGVFDLLREWLIQRVS